MDVDLILQPFDDESSLHEVLAAALTDPAFEHLDIVVAWTKDSGLHRLREALADFNAREGTSSRLVTGLDEGGGTKEGLESALELFDECFLLYDASSGTFHPKIYVVSGPDRTKLIVGSNNLTAGGLYFNYEAAQVTELDAVGDADLIERVKRYIDRLISDDTSRRLTAELIKELADDENSVLGTEARGSEEAPSDRRPTTGYRKLRDLFGRSRHAKKKDPKARRAVARPTGGAGQAGGVGTGGGGAAGRPTLAARWTKRLTASDCGQPRAGSNTTGALRFVKAGQPIDQTDWFRNVLFGDVAWSPDGRPGRERATVDFEVTVAGVSRGTHALVLKHDGRREAGQNNFTTDLKWGSLNPVLRQHDAVSEWAIFDRFSDGSFAITIQPQEPALRFQDLGRAP